MNTNMNNDRHEPTAGHHGLAKTKQTCRTRSTLLVAGKVPNSSDVESRPPSSLSEPQPDITALIDAMAKSSTSGAENVQPPSNTHHRAPPNGASKMTAEFSGLPMAQSFSLTRYGPRPNTGHSTAYRLSNASKGGCG